jgi:hypothetical protein
MRLQGLSDAPRSGAPRKISDDCFDEIVKITLTSRPANATHWSVREMAAKTGLSPASVHRIWKTFELQPHRVETFKLSTDPLFVEKLRDVVGLYMAPPERAIELCVDEKSQVQAIDRTGPIFPMRPGVPERQTTITFVTASRLCSRRSTLQRVRSSVLVTDDIGTKNSFASCVESMMKF